MFRLKNWHMELRSRGPVAFGECYDNPKFSNGFRVHTSVVSRLEPDSERKTLNIFTHSGSCYRADWEDMDENEAESTGEVFQSTGVPFDMEQCLAFKRQRREEKERKLSEMLYPGWLYVEMAGSYTLRSSWFKNEEGELVPIPVTRHLSTFSSDSFLITDWETGLCDWRIFSEGSAVTPYRWSESIKAVYLENTGDNFVFRGADREMLCESGKITFIEREDNG